MMILQNRPADDDGTTPRQIDSSLNLVEATLRLTKGLVGTARQHAQGHSTIDYARERLQDQLAPLPEPERHLLNDDDLEVILEAAFLTWVDAA